MLSVPVVITGDGSCADICVRANISIANVAQMVDLGTWRYGCVFHFDKITDLGVTVHTEKATKVIESGSDSRYTMQFADGSSLDTDMILFSAGIRPSDALAKQHDLAMGERGGIVIDDVCKTSDDSIYAIGECAFTGLHGANRMASNSLLECVVYGRLAAEDLLDKLDFGANKEKENAFDEIVKMNEGAIPFIKSYLQNSNTLSNSSELSVEVLYEVMLSKYKVSKNFNLYDEVVYNGKNTVEGTWVFQDIILETSYGRIKVARKNIESIDIKTMAAEGFSKDNSFKVFANRYVLGNKEEAWLNTGILVKKGQEIKITADGEISLASLSGNKYSPDGGVNGSPGPTDKKLNYGNLVFRISQNGTPIKAGDNLKITAERTGIIFISIYETVFNSANSGFYTANVRVK